MCSSDSSFLKYQKITMDRPKTGTGRGSKSKTPQFPDDLYVLGPKGARTESTETKRPLPVPAKPGPSNPLIGKI